MVHDNKKQDEIIRHLDTHKSYPQDCVLDYMFLRSREWKDLPSPVKVSLCAAAMEFKYKDIWNISIKLSTTNLREHCATNKTPASNLVEVIQNAFESKTPFMGSLRHESDVHDQGIYANILLPFPHDLDNFEIEYFDIIKNLSVNGIFSYDPVIPTIELNTKEFGFSANGAAVYVLKNLKYPSRIRKYLNSKSIDELFGSGIKFINTPNGILTKKSIKDVSLKRKINSFYFDDLFFMSDIVSKLGQDLFIDFKPELISKYHSSLLEAA